MAVFKPSNSSIETSTVSNDVSRSARSSSALQEMMLSMSEFRMLGKRLVIAEPATVDNEARAFALNDVIGDAVSVGIRFGSIMFDLVVSVKRVSNADNAL